MALNANNIRTGKYEVLVSCDGGATYISAGYMQDLSLSYESEINELESHQGTVATCANAPTASLTFTANETACDQLVSFNAAQLFNDGTSDIMEFGRFDQCIGYNACEIRLHNTCDSDDTLDWVFPEVILNANGDWNFDNDCSLSIPFEAIIQRTTLPSGEQGLFYKACDA